VWRGRGGLLLGSTDLSAEDRRASETRRVHDSSNLCGYVVIPLKRKCEREAGLWTYFLFLSAMFTSTDGGRTVLMFSKLGGETTEKHTKKTSVWGYDNGRSRLSHQLCHGIGGILQSDHPIRCLIAKHKGRSKDLQRLTRNPPDLLYPTVLDLWVFHQQAPKPSNYQIQSVHICQISSGTSLRYPYGILRFD